MAVIATATVAVTVLAVLAETGTAFRPYVPLNSLTIKSLYTNRTESEGQGPSPRVDRDQYQRLGRSRFVQMNYQPNMIYRVV